MHDVTNQLALITGGAAGIGAGMAQAFLDAGMRVIIADRSEAALARALDRFAAHAGRVHGVELDVRDRDGWKRTTAHIRDTHGNLHLLCNNAGLGGVTGRLMDCPEADFDLMLGVNLIGIYNGVRALGPDMAAHGEGGHIVNTASIIGHFPSMNSAIYSASKFGVVGMSETLRNEMRPLGIGVSLLCPGNTRTDIYENWERLRAVNQGKDQIAAPPVASGVHQGMDPLAVGRRVLRAVRDDEFYIFTHPEYRRVFAARFETILAAHGESAEPGHADDVETVGRAILRGAAS